MKKFQFIFYIIVNLITLSSCNPFKVFAPTSDELANKNWAFAKTSTDTQNLYCYRTLGEMMCYPHPLPGQESRLISNPTNQAGPVATPSPFKIFTEKLHRTFYGDQLQPAN